MDSLGGLHVLVNNVGMNIRAPTLILVGQEDPLTPPEHSKAMAAAIPGARYEVVQGASHLAPMERADEVSEAMVRFVKSSIG